MSEADVLREELSPPQGQAAIPPAKISMQPSRGGGQGVLWDRFQEIARECGLELFDIDSPHSRYGTLRVYITRPRGSAACTPNISFPLTTGTETASEVDSSGVVPLVLQTRSVTSGGIAFEDCVRVSKQISALMESEEGQTLGLSDNDWSLEVSSPGINRTLRLPEHFAGAIGERIRLKIPSALLAPEGGDPSAPSGRKRQLVVGVLRALEGELLQVELEKTGQSLKVPLGQVYEARVDFLFK